MEYFRKERHRLDCAKCITEKCVLYCIRRQKLNMILEIESLRKNLQQYSEFLQSWREERLDKVITAEKTQKKIQRDLLRLKSQQRSGERGRLLEQSEVDSQYEDLSIFNEDSGKMEVSRFGQLPEYKTFYFGRPDNSYQ